LFFRKELKKNPKLEEKVQDCLQKWEEGDKKTLDTWKKMNKWALDGFKETYKKFNLKMDKEYFESEYYMEGRSIVQEALKKGIAKKKKDGAIYVDLTKEGLGEKILLRADGTSIYVTQDLYLANLRQKEFKFDKAFYVVATEQNYHFKMLFTILKLLGYKWAQNLHHLKYGLVNLESGRMKSREGTVIDADDIIEEMESLALKGLKKRDNNLPKAEKEKRAKAIAMAAIRYYFLKVDKIKDMTFKPEESIKFEGDTGPYLLYTYARAKSILRKSKKKPKPSTKDLSDAEKNLVFQLSQYPQIAKKAYNNIAPNIVANYAFQVSQSFNEFYHATKVIGSKKEAFLLSLTSAFAQTLKNALSLLEIPVLEEM